MCRTGKLGLLVCIWMVCMLAQNDCDFQWYTREFNKSYQGTEYDRRKETFAKSCEEIKKANGAQGSSYTLNINQFADWTEEELNNLTNYIEVQNETQSFNLNNFKSQKGDTHHLRVGTASSLDYRLLGKVTPARNQGSCGSCWAFTSTAQIESLMLINGWKESDLSEQRTLQCTKTHTSLNNDCRGGYVSSALSYLTNVGTSYEAYYPYRAGGYGPRQGTPYTQGICQAQSVRVGKGRTSIYTRMTDEEMKILLQNEGPVSAAIYAPRSLMYYSRGVFTGCPSGSSKINHAVLVVGFTADGNWIIKNSWGGHWGQNGFGIISRGNDCGVTKFVYHLRLTKLFPTQEPPPMPNSQRLLTIVITLFVLILY